MAPDDSVPGRDILCDLLAQALVQQWVGSGRIGKKLGLGVGLAIGLRSKKIVLKKKKTALAKSHKAHKAVHHKVKHQTVCSHVPVKRCTSIKQCEKVSWQKCVQMPVKNCKQVSNTKC